MNQRTKRLRGLFAIAVVAVIGLLGAVATLEPLFNYLWPRQPDPNQSVNNTIQVYRRPDGTTTICQPAEPTDDHLDRVASMVKNGYTYEEARKWYLDRELETAPPKCLTLPAIPQ